MPTTATVHLEVPDLEGIESADDQQLMQTMQQWSRARRVVDAGLARLAGVVAARSSVELGYSGLAQRQGARTADALVSQLTGTSGAEARAITSVGVTLTAPEPWLTGVASGVAHGELSIGAAAAISTGLGNPLPPSPPTISPTQLVSWSPPPAPSRPRRSPAAPESSATNSTKPASPTAKRRCAASGSCG